MRHEELSSFIERFNEENDPFAIGLNFVVAGIGNVQRFIEHVQNGTFDAAKHRPLLEEAAQMLAFGKQRLGERTDAGAPLLRFVDRYLAFARELAAKTAR